MFNILNLLVVTINQKLRESKAALEVEEKTRTIAEHQGYIVGWRKLLGYLVDFFELTDEFIACAGDVAPVIESIGTAEIHELHAEKEALVATEKWDSLLKEVADNREYLKERLITTADSARDLYLAQSQHCGITAFSPLFNAISEEYNRRQEELAFDDGDTPGELPSDE